MYINDPVLVTISELYDLLSKKRSVLKEPQSKSSFSAKYAAIILVNIHWDTILCSDKIKSASHKKNSKAFDYINTASNRLQ